MLYNYLKIIHIISASFVLTSIVYSFHLWRSIHAHNLASICERIQKQTLLVIVPFAVLQLATGFSMISMKRYNIQDDWVGGSVIGFITAIASWFGFIYFLLLSQQFPIRSNRQNSTMRLRRLQSIMLLFCAFGLLSMIFFMSNKNG